MAYTDGHVSFWLKSLKEGTACTRTKIRKKRVESHEYLRYALQGYLDACLELEANCVRPSLSKGDETELEASLVAIKHEISFPDLDGNLLRGALTSLKRARNSSSKDVPIRRLPPELLSRIFVTVTCDDKVDSDCDESTPSCERSARNLSTVCHQWRQVAIQTRELWSHIDIGVTNDLPNGSAYLAALWLERARNAPLYIHIHAGRMEFGAFEDAIKPLTQRVAQFRSLNISGYSAGVLASLIDLWLNDSASNPLDALVLFHRRDSSVEDGGCVFPSERPPLKRANALLVNMRILGLHGTYLDWDLYSFQSLVELELWNIPEESGPTVEQLSNLISANPELRSICVERTTILAVPDYKISPIKLARLETLRLGADEDGSLTVLLDLLEPHPSTFRRLRLVGTYGFSRVESIALEAFCSKVKLANIYFESFDDTECIARLVIKIPTLRSLMLDRLELRERFFDTLAHPRNTTISDSKSTEEESPFNNSALRNLYLRECAISPFDLQDFITAWPMKHLEVLCCSLPRDLAREYAEESTKGIEWAMPELPDRLKDHVPSLRFVTLDE